MVEYLKQINMSDKQKTRYSASFTAGSLLHKETTVLLPLIQSDQREENIRQEIKNNQYLKINSESARKRTVAEIIKRVQNTDHVFWTRYEESTIEEQKMMLFYLCLKTYTLMFDFHFNVTLKQWNSSSRNVDPYFYQMEIEEIASHDEIVYNWTDITKQKTISVYMRILRDIKLINRQNELQQVNMNDNFWHYFVNSRGLWFLDAALLNTQDKERIMRL